MKRMKVNKIVSLIIVLIMVASVITACDQGASTKQTAGTPSVGTTTGKPAEPVEITYLHCWNGGGGNFPQDPDNCEVLDYLTEKTGVRLKLESITTSEVEKLNLMFASGTLPDLVNAPYWSSTGGEGAVIKKGAIEGQILAIDEYLDKYPNVNKLCTVGIAKDFYQYDLHPPEYEGKTYLIPQQTPDGTVESITNFAYGCYARGDILKALNVNPADIDTPDELYNLLVDIKNGGFKDINGKPVIPAGTLHNGWDYTRFLEFWSDYNISSYREENGKIIHYIFSKDEEEKLRFMRKLIKEGLFDPEAFSNTDTMGKEKLITGKLAVFGAQPMTGDLQTLYKTNPEMLYEKLGPFKNRNGQPVAQVEKKGRSGFPVMFLSAQTKYAEDILRMIDWINSEEGLIFTYWGIENVHHTIVNGVPKWIPEVKEKFAADVTNKRDAGLWLMPTFVGAFSNDVKWPKDESELTEDEKLLRSYWAKTPIVLVDKVSAAYLGRSYPKRQEFLEKTAQLDYDATLRQAFYVDTDEEALKMLNDFRQKYIEAGILEYVDYIAEQAKGRDDVGF